MKFIRIISAFLFLPFVFSAVYAVVKLILGFAVKSDMSVIPFWIGIIVYMLFQAVFLKPMRTYVFGHELTHALAGVLSGAKIKKIKISKNGGSVTLNKDNIFITLSPYFVPFYSLIIITVYMILSWFADTAPFYPYYLFLSGAALAFHFALTFYAISMGQEDLKSYGVFFSFVFICFVNCIVISLVFILIFPTYIELKTFFESVFVNGIFIYKYIIAKIMYFSQ